MSEIKHSLKTRRHNRFWQTGTTAVEFALVFVVFFGFLCGVIELTRAMYVYNALQESTRRAAAAAATVNFRDAAAMAKVQEDAVFRDKPGDLVLGEPVSDKHIRIDYLSLVRNSDGSMKMNPVTSLPTCPAHNRHICMANPNDPNCIRFVRVRVCDPADAGKCNNVPYKTIFPLVTLPLTLPKATTIAAVESLGFTIGTGPCP